MSPLWSPLHRPTATLCHTTATAARAGVRMDLIGSRGVWLHVCVERIEGSGLMSAKVRDDLVLSHAEVTAEVEAPFDRVDIARWLKTYRRTISALCTRRS